MTIITSFTTFRHFHFCIVALGLSRQYNFHIGLSRCRSPGLYDRYFAAINVRSLLKVLQNEIRFSPQLF